VFAGVSALLLAGLATATPAQAGDVPPAPVTEFRAPVCAGTTSQDPKQVNPGDHHGETDLTRVFGARLVSYNKGNVVPLYDTFGGADGAYPALCGTYYDPETQGPKSVWMFCTDVRSKVCGDLGPGGTLSEGATPKGEMSDLPKNSRLDKTQERIIGWLLQNGHPYDRSPGEPATTRADQTSSANRFALQNLIWCVSDPDLTNATFQAMCSRNLPQTEMDRILSMTAETAVVNLLLTSSGDVVVGTPREITLNTNVYNQPITLNATGTAAGSLTVCGGPAALNGNQLTVSGTDPTQNTTVKLCLTPSKAGSYGLEATAAAVSSDHLQWAQSGSDCQVFARFRHDAGAPVSARIGFTIKQGLDNSTKSQPKLTTKASHKVARPGAKLHDTVKLTGFKAGHGSRGTATLFGPLTKVTSKSCTPANKVASVSFTPRNGSVRTSKIKVTRPGYYTWVASTSADSKNKAASHKCGLAVETTLVRKKQYNISKVDTGFSGVAASDQTLARMRPNTVSMPATQLNATLTGSGHRKGRMLIPGDVQTVGQLNASAAIGDKVGTTVLAGHVSDAKDRPGAMWSLKKARKGQVITVDANGKKVKYRVTKVERFSRAGKLPARLFNTAGQHRLVLISCADKVTKDGRWHYTNNLVVTAVPVK
jgi:hypothetical protein